MVKVDEYARIRRAHRVDKMSIHELARRFHHSRRKIREILTQPEPKPYRRRAMPSVVDPFKPVIDAILCGDETAPPKQQHTVAKLVRRLRDEYGYTGGYERVRHYVRSRYTAAAETFIPLDHEPGQRLRQSSPKQVLENRFPSGRPHPPRASAAGRFGRRGHGPGGSAGGGGGVVMRAACQRCGSRSASCSAGCVGRRVNTSRR